MHGPVGQDEDKRVAATIATSLSGYVIAGALAIIGAEAAIFVFLLDGKELSIWLILLLFLTFAALFGSCYLGGQGVWEIYDDGYKGTWKIEVGGKFAYQLFWALVGIVLLFISSFLAIHAKGKPKEGAAVDSQALAQELATLDAIPGIKNRLDQMERTLDEIRNRPPEDCSAKSKGPSKSTDPRK
jgi:hypothetical protein